MDEAEHPVSAAEVPLYQFCYCCYGGFKIFFILSFLIQISPKLLPNFKYAHVLTKSGVVTLSSEVAPAETEHGNGLSKPTWPVPMPVSDADLISIYEIQYEDALKVGKITPLIIPYHFLNFFILVVYIVLSHYETTRRLRFPVLGFVVWHSASMLLSTRTLNHSYGSIIGLYSI
jgi:hypothetical protein